MILWFWDKTFSSKYEIFFFLRSFWMKDHFNVHGIICSIEINSAKFFKSKLPNLFIHLFIYCAPKCILRIKYNLFQVIGWQWSWFMIPFLPCWTLLVLLEEEIVPLALWMLLAPILQTHDSQPLGCIDTLAFL